MRVFIIATFAVVLMAGCSRGVSTKLRRAASNGPVIPTDYTIFDDLGSQGAQTCASISGTLTRVSPLGAVEVGQDVIFEINVLNCGKYRIERLDGAAGGTFSQSKVWYTKRFTATSNSIQEGIRIIGIDSEGGSVSPITVLATAFAVAPAGSSAPLSCVAAPIVPVVNIEVDAMGNPVDAPPAIGFSISSNKNASVINVANFAGAIFPRTTLPTPASKYQNAEVVVANLYQNMLEFEVKDAADASKTAKCSANVYLRPIVRVAAPTCRITPSKTFPYVGENVTFTLTIEGQYSTASWRSSSVVSGAQVTLPIPGPTQVSADIVGPGGTGHCEVTVTPMAVVINPVKIGINFEDSTDSDYIDSVVCTNGKFSIEGNQIISLADQTVSVRGTKLSAYNHTVTFLVYTPSGVALFTKTYLSSALPTFSVYVPQGARISATFNSQRGSHAGQTLGLGSQFVRHGNYCNQTGG
jgi:hypothetical protein